MTAYLPLKRVGSQTSWQIASMSATEVVAQLCSRKMTALQYAEAVLEIAETYSCLNIFSFLDRRKVRCVCRAVPTSWHTAVHQVPVVHSLKEPLTTKEAVLGTTPGLAKLKLLCCRCWQKPERWTPFMQQGRTSSRSAGCPLQ